jgi:hypothetical protein
MLSALYKINTYQIDRVRTKQVTGQLIYLIKLVTYSETVGLPTILPTEAVDKFSSGKAEIPLTVSIFTS